MKRSAGIDKLAAREGMFRVTKKTGMSVKIINELRDYIKSHGFGAPIPELAKVLSVDEFKQHYYTVVELKSFCNSIGISSAGVKSRLNARIEKYLSTGKVTVVKPYKPSGRPDSELGLTLDKKVIYYKSDPNTRAFFQQHILEFTGFSALVQKQIKERLSKGEDFTYGDAIEMHKQYLIDKRKAKAQGGRRKVAHDSCQLNQFSIDYSSAPGAKAHSSKEAWYLVRDTAGKKTFMRYKERIDEIKSIIMVDNKNQVSLNKF